MGFVSLRKLSLVFLGNFKKSLYTHSMKAPALTPPFNSKQLSQINIFAYFQKQGYSTLESFYNFRVSSVYER